MPKPTGLGGTIRVDMELKGLPPTVHSEPLISVPTSLGGTIPVGTELTGLSFGVSAPTNKNSRLHTPQKHDLVIDFSHMMSLHTGCVCLFPL